MTLSRSIACALVLCAVGVVAVVLWQKSTTKTNVASATQNPQTSTEPLPADTSLPEVAVDPATAGPRSLEHWMLDYTDPLDHYTVSTITQYIIYPMTPDEAYIKNIAAAEAGDPLSMFLVSKSFEECLHAPRNREDFERFWLANTALQPFWDIAEHKMERCQAFSAMFKDDVRFDAEADYWLTRSAEAGYLTARAELLMDEMEPPIQSDPVYEEVQRVVSLATRSEGYPAYYEMGRLVSLQEGSQDTTGHAAAYAWYYAGCKLHPGCDAKKQFLAITKDMFEYEIDEFLRLVEEVEASVHKPN